jgi:glycosyltransferase involved in cell wall biosynthesis
MDDCPLVGFLCYNLSPASTSVLGKIAQHAANFTVKAYPLLGSAPEKPLPFPYRPSGTLGKYVVFNNMKGTAPESQLLTLGWPVVRDLVKESDIVGLMGVQSVPAILATFIARSMGKPVLAISQTMGPFAEKRRPAIVRLLKGLVLRLSSVHVAQTPPTVATLQQVYDIPESRIVSALWDGAASDFVPVLNQYGSQPRAQLRASLGLPPSAYIVLFCGTLIYLKGVDILLDAFSKLLATCPQSVLLIVGHDGGADGMRTELECQATLLEIRSQVRFLGRQPWEQLARIYGAADVFVLPTRRDMWPKVLVEAALAGLPLITTEVCGAAGYLVRHGVNGLVVPVQDTQSVVEALLDLRDDALRIRMGEASRELVQEFMRPDVEVKGLLSAVELCLSLMMR